eukprot:154703-Rhodomonas_salina.1
MMFILVSVLVVMYQSVSGHTFGTLKMWHVVYERLEGSPAGLQYLDDWHTGILLEWRIAPTRLGVYCPVQYTATVAIT